VVEQRRFCFRFHANSGRKKSGFSSVIFRVPNHVGREREPLHRRGTTRAFHSLTERAGRSGEVAPNVLMATPDVDQVLWRPRMVAVEDAVLYFGRWSTLGKLAATDHARRLHVVDRR